MGIPLRGPAPSASDHIDTKLYSDQRMYAFEPPFTGWWSIGPGFTGAATGAPVLNRVQFTPFFVGPVGWTSDQFNLNQTVAAAGGDPTLEVAVYGDDGTGTPLTAGGPLRRATLTTAQLTAAAALRAAAWTAAGASSPIVLTPGLYWIATRYTHATAPSTAPTFTTVSNTMWQLANTTGANQPAVRAYVLTGQTALPTAAMTSLSFTGDALCPVVALRRSA